MARPLPFLLGGQKGTELCARSYKGAPGRQSSWIELRLHNPGIEKIDRK